MKVAVTGIIHPKSVLYYNDYLKSILNQSYKEFDLALFTQGIENSRGIYLDGNYSLAEAKQKSIEQLIDLGYDIIIFTDTDDFYHKDYIKSHIEALKNNLITFTDMNIYFKDGTIKNYFRKCGVPEYIDKDYINKRSPIGWGNSAFRTTVYDIVDKFPDDWRTCDWWVFKQLIKYDTKAYFINKALMYYRQHDGNINTPDFKQFKLWNEI